MIEGHFIVLEGIDGSGTTTQCSILADRLADRGLPTHVTREPSDGPVGVLRGPGARAAAAADLERRTGRGARAR